MADWASKGNELLREARARIANGTSPIAAATDIIQALGPILVPCLYLTACAKVADANDAEDIVQQTLVGLWKGLIGGRCEIANLEGYVHQILEYRCIDRYELRGGKGGKAKMRPREEPIDGHAARLVAPGSQSPDEIEREAQHELFRRALERLSEVDRDIVLSYMDHQSLRTTAESQGIGKGKVRSALKRLEIALRDILRISSAGQEARP